MYTRDSLNRNYTVYAPPSVVAPGFVRMTVHKGIPQTWAVVRPGSSPDPNGAPFYTSGYRPNIFQYGGVFQVKPARPNVEMDPSDKSTWQRQYYFS